MSARLFETMKQKEIFSVPNILSFIRIILVGVFVFVFLQTEGKGFSWWPIIVLVVSGLTDLLDGYIARHYNQITDLGKILDPVADKLTQIAVCACLSVRYHQMIWLLIFYIVKELAIGIGGLFQLRKIKTVPFARWYGKLATCELYVAMGILLLIPNMEALYVNIIIILTLAIALFALIMYVRLFYNENYKKSIKGES